MVILGFGTNVGDRFHLLREALRLVKLIPEFSVLQVSPVYQSDALLTEDAPDEWNKPYLNLALRCDTSLEPLALLSQVKNIEKLLGRKPEKVWAPRPIDIDILAWDDLNFSNDVLDIPHEHLAERPFALWPLSDVAPFWIYPVAGQFQGKTAHEIGARWGSKFSGSAPLHTTQIQHRIDTPQLMGILNITPDSFSDGGNYLSVENALNKAATMVNEGAHIIDIGAEATGPNATPLTPEVEWTRLENVLIEISRARHTMKINPKLSVDTRFAMNAEKALNLGVDIINDQSACADENMPSVVVAHDCEIVFMHQLGIPTRPDKIIPLHQNCILEIIKWAQEKISYLEKLNISASKMIFDVGIGFGKNAIQSLEILQNIAAFFPLNVKLMVGHSRKSFLQLFTEKEAAERDVETLAVSLYLANQNVDYLRVHNVGDCARVLKISESMSNSR